MAEIDAKVENKDNENKIAQAAPVSLQALVLAEVNWVDQHAVSKEERTAVISGAGVALYQVGLREKALEFLKNEAEKSSAPYYYFSALSSLAKKEKNIPEAKKWAHLAKNSAVGRATKVQWTAIELNLSLENYDGVTHENEISPESLLADYYELVFSLDDGFQGRNGSIAKRIAKNLAPLARQKKMSQVISKYKKKCLALSPINGSKKSACRAHFKAISLGEEIPPKSLK